MKTLGLYLTAPPRKAVRRNVSSHSFADGGMKRFDAAACKRIHDHFTH